MTDAPAFVCPRCGAVSHNPTDVAEGYCGRCHDWTGADHLAVRVVNLPPTEIVCSCGARFVGPDCLDRMHEHKAANQRT